MQLVHAPLCGNVRARETQHEVECACVTKHTAHLDRDDGFLVAIVEADPQILSLPELLVDAVEEEVLLRVGCLW